VTLVRLVVSRTARPSTVAVRPAPIGRHLDRDAQVADLIAPVVPSR
jgi:hypothetical protein